MLNFKTIFYSELSVFCSRIHKRDFLKIVLERNKSKGHSKKALKTKEVILSVS